MRLIVSILLITALSLLATSFMPWWSLAIIAFAVGVFLPMRPGSSFLAGFLGIFLLWIAVGLFYDVPNAHLMSTRMAKVFFLPDGYLYITVSAIIGGLVGGLACWSAALWRKSLRVRKASALQ